MTQVEYTVRELIDMWVAGVEQAPTMARRRTQVIASIPDGFMDRLARSITPQPLRRCGGRWFLRPWTASP